MKKKSKVLKITLISFAVFAVLLSVFVYILLSNIYNDKVPIVERVDEYIPDISLPEEIIELPPENDVLDEISETEEDEFVFEKEDENTAENTDETDNKVSNLNNNDKNTYGSPKKQVPIYKKDRIDDNILNILLIGSDSRNPKIDRGRSDSMIVLSYNKEKRKATMLSMQRDSLVPIEDHGWNRINTAYFFGGAGLAINTINDLFDLDIQYYVITNFDGFIESIDKIGGVEVNLTAAEAEYYNKNNGWSLKEGLNNLTGKQALTHSRNRTTGRDSDFGRTRRQQDVLLSAYKKAMNQKEDIATITSLLEFGLTKVNTNLPIDIIYSILSDVLSGEPPEIVTGHMPFKGTWKSVWYKKMLVLQIDISENKNLIKQILY